MSKALAGMNPVYNEFQSLLRAAYNAARLHSTIEFDKVRGAVFKDIRPRYQRMLSAMHYVSGQQSVGDPVGDGCCSRGAALQSGARPRARASSG